MKLFLTTMLFFLSLSIFAQEKPANNQTPTVSVSQTPVVNQDRSDIIGDFLSKDLTVTAPSGKEQHITPRDIVLGVVGTYAVLLVTVSAVELSTAHSGGLHISF